MAAPATRRRKVSPAKFLGMEDAVRYELADGELQERNVSVLSSEVGAIVIELLSGFARQHRLGVVLGTDIGLQIFPGRPSRIPRPDAAFIAADRITPAVRASEFLKVAPDLIVEVVSPGDTAGAMQKKVDEYLEAGVRLVWVVYPESRRVLAYRSDGEIAISGPSGNLDGGDVLPGFSVPVADLFPQ